MQPVSTHLVGLEDLSDLAGHLVSGFKPTDCICLTAPMGGGKTTFAFFLARAWLKQEPAGFASPTFTILNQYHASNGRLVNHLDLYRLDVFSDLDNLDLGSEFAKSGALTLVEWGEKFFEWDAVFTHRIEIATHETDSQKRWVRLFARSGK